MFLEARSRVLAAATESLNCLTVAAAHSSRSDHAELRLLSGRTSETAISKRTHAKNTSSKQKVTKIDVSQESNQDFSK